MDSLKELDLKFKYRSDCDKIYIDFYERCLDCSIKYDRAVGYFTSDSLKLIARGLEKFIASSGEIRMIVNPRLTKEDIEAIDLGYKAKKDVITACLLETVEVCSKNVKDNTLNILAWLIYKNLLTIKIAYTNDNSIYHEKFGIFYDKYGNKVVFSGSANETVGGLVNNFEKIDVYYEDYEKRRVDDAISDFNNLWSNNTDYIEVIDIPTAVKKKIIEHKKDNIYAEKSKDNNITPREYQIEAYNNFKINNYNGILEMATGTGKTITSLYIANNYKISEGRIFLIILVPFTHLVEQWEENTELFGFNNVLRCYDSKNTWVNKLDQRVRDFNIGLSKDECIISTYKTASAKEFNDLIYKIRGKSFIIADECHYFGIRSLRNNKFNNIWARLGLSATPDRWWDEEGTSYLRSYFGDTVYEYSLEEAIRSGILTEYTYDPIICKLSEKELKEYEKITRMIIAAVSNKDKDKLLDIEELNRKRSLIISKAENKVDKLLELFKIKDISNTSHTLVYCAPGQVNYISSKLAELGFRVHKFNSEVSTEDRRKILKSFEKGIIQILIAIKCLDEGVDVPSTREAYFIASTSNPREFIQRRGRVLRKSSGKTMANIYDFIVLPENADEGIFKSIVSKEMPRFAEFSRYSINEFIARSEVARYLKVYDLEHLMDMLPWEVYNEMKENWSDNNGY